MPKIRLSLTRNSGKTRGKVLGAILVEPCFDDVAKSARNKLKLSAKDIKNIRLFVLKKKKSDDFIEIFRNNSNSLSVLQNDVVVSVSLGEDFNGFHSISTLSNQWEMISPPKYPLDTKNIEINYINPLFTEIEDDDRNEVVKNDNINQPSYENIQDMSHDEGHGNYAMNGDYPILHGDVLLRIKSCISSQKSCFYIKDRGDFLAIDYSTSGKMANLFPDVSSCGKTNSRERWEAAIKRECRGLIICQKTGKVLARRFHKFWNIDELPESNSVIVNDNIRKCAMNKTDIIITEKIDGSLCSPLLLQINQNSDICMNEQKLKENYKVFWALRTVLSDEIQIFVSNFDIIINQNQQRNQIPIQSSTSSMSCHIKTIEEEDHFPMWGYDALAWYLLSIDVTPLFEWCDTSGTVGVIHHDAQSLTLIGARDMINGSYYSKSQLYEVSTQFKVPTVKQYYLNEKDLLAATNSAQFIQKFVSKWTHREGVVLSLGTHGEIGMYKVKSEWYVSLAAASKVISSSSSHHSGLEKSCSELLELLKLRPDLHGIPPHLIWCAALACYGVSGADDIVTMCRSMLTSLQDTHPTAGSSDDVGALIDAETNLEVCSKDGCVFLRGTMLDDLIKKVNHEDKNCFNCVSIPESYQLNRIARDGSDGTHITLINRKELSKLLSHYQQVKHQTPQQSLNLVLKMFNGCLQNEMNESILRTPLPLGVGSVLKQSKKKKQKKGEGNDDECFYICCEWPSGQVIRSLLGLPDKQFHVTIGFKNKDIHDVDKGISTLVSVESPHNLLPIAKIWLDLCKRHDQKSSSEGSSDSHSLSVWSHHHRRHYLEAVCDISKVALTGIQKQEASSNLVSLELQAQSLLSEALELLCDDNDDARNGKTVPTPIESNPFSQDGEEEEEVDVEDLDKGVVCMIEHIYLDLDGVLADFEGGVKSLLGQSTKKLPASEMWKSIKHCNWKRGFFGSLEWQEGGKTLWYALKSFAGTHGERISILTGLPSDGNKTWASDQKKFWCNKKLPKESYGHYKQVICCMSLEKKDYASKNMLLIDDRIHNCVAWEASGGVAIHHKTLEDTMQALFKLGVVTDKQTLAKGKLSLPSTSSSSSSTSSSSSSTTEVRRIENSTSGHIFIVFESLLAEKISLLTSHFMNWGQAVLELANQQEVSAPLEEPGDDELSLSSTTSSLSSSSRNSSRKRCLMEHSSVALNSGWNAKLISLCLSQQDHVGVKSLVEMEIVNILCGFAKTHQFDALRSLIGLEWGEGCEGQLQILESSTSAIHTYSLPSSTTSLLSSSSSSSSASPPPPPLTSSTTMSSIAHPPKAYMGTITDIGVDWKEKNLTLSPLSPQSIIFSLLTTTTLQTISGGAEEVMIPIEKVVVILRGLPGCGKSSFAKLLTRKLKSNEFTICSADMFFEHGAGVLSNKQKKNQTKEDIYLKCFDHNKLPKAHGYCRATFQQAISNHHRCNVVVVDNTNIQKREYLYYEKAAVSAGYKIVVVEIDSQYGSKGQGGGQSSNLHGVSPADVGRMSARWEEDERAVKLQAFS